MLNFGLASLALVAKRQQRMIRTLGQNLLSSDAKTDCNAGTL
ncbi:hypothetical protein PITC_045380 [Penicillium italicum]|uniref:Uncharacterized protein n=1 Tax=Penicillium italicum TaxID=40296 RepID=A0A0A2KRY5_PENIT|nr:hypothetical protein PITC_045380 [Penicillium italicum]